MKTYAEKLKDPRWQRKRLEVLNRENFTCEYCGCTDECIHVHHSYYEKGKEPWEYESEYLHALCSDCHKYASAHDRFPYSLREEILTGLQQAKAVCPTNGDFVIAISAISEHIEPSKQTA